MTNFLKHVINKFRNEERGSLAVEAVIILPILFWAMTATFTFFHAYKAQNAIFRANYTISDVISRESTQITPAYMRGLQNIYQFMTLSQTENTWIRVTVVQCKTRCSNNNRDLEILWSRGTNGARDLDENDFDHWESKIPWLPKGDSLVLVETSSTYVPPFTNFMMNFPERQMVSHSVTRPRFTPQILWEGMNAGNDGNAQNDEKDDRGHNGNGNGSG